MYIEIDKIYQKELKRQQTTIELIASENFASDAVMKLCGSEFTNKYAEGYPGRRYYNGCEHMDEIETLAIDTLKEIYGCKYANVQWKQCKRIATNLAGVSFFPIPGSARH